MLHPSVSPFTKESATNCTPNPPFSPRKRHIAFPKTKKNPKSIEFYSREEFGDLRDFPEKQAFSMPIRFRRIPLPRSSTGSIRPFEGIIELPHLSIESEAAP
jgi:hypothetical protein